MEGVGILLETSQKNGEIMEPMQIDGWGAGDYTWFSFKVK